MKVNRLTDQANHFKNVERLLETKDKQKNKISVLEHVPLIEEDLYLFVYKMSI